MHTQVQPFQQVQLERRICRQRQASIDGGVNDDAARIGLVCVMHQLEFDTETVANPVGSGVWRHDLQQSVVAVDSAVAASEAGRSHVCGCQSVAAGNRRHVGRGHAAMGRTNAAGLGCGEADRGNQLAVIEPEEAPDCHGGADATRNTGHVPTEIGAGAIGDDRVAQPAFDFDPDNQCEQEILAGCADAVRGLMMERRQHRGGDRTGRVRDGLEMGVVKRLGGGIQATQQRRIGHVEAFRPAWQRRIARPAHRRDCADRDFRRDRIGAANSACDPVQERASGFLADDFRKCAPRCRQNKVGDLVRDRRFPALSRVAGTC